MSKETIIALHAEHQGRWKNREEIAERMIALIGQLYREKNIVVSVYGRSLINRSVIQILKSHRRTRMLDVELSVVHTFPILEALMKVENIGSAEVDIGKLAVEYKNQGGDVDDSVHNGKGSTPLFFAIEKAVALTAVVLLAASGAAGAIVLVGGRTLLQRGTGCLAVQRRGGGLQKRQQLPAIGCAQMLGYWLQRGPNSRFKLPTRQLEPTAQM